MSVGVIIHCWRTAIEIGIVKDYASVWLHIDAAWAGPALSCPEYRDMCYLEDINEVATSFCTNFHKVRRPPSPMTV